MGKKLENALVQIEKLYGKGSLMYIGDDRIVDCESISTGSILVDKATGIGGFPRGRICEVYGPESSGKTTLTLHVIAEAQKEGLACAFIDAEHALDIQYARKLGVDVEKILLSQPDYGEQGLDIVDKLTETQEIDLIVIDSVAALTPRNEIEGDYGDAQMASQARMMSQAMRKLTGKVSKSNTCVIFINQIREKIGVVFGNPEDTTGGRALKFYASLRVETRFAGQVKVGDVNVANKTKVKIVKNKLSPPFRTALVEIRFGIGIDFIKELISLAVEYDIIKKGGAWYTLGEDRFQGEEKLRSFLEKDLDVFEYVKGKILEGMEKEISKKTVDSEDDIEY